jgi:hypothetical protein
MIALAIVEVMVDVSVKMFGATKPGARAYKNTTLEPLGSIVAIWSAIVGRNFVVTIGTNGGRPDIHRDLGVCVLPGNQESPAGSRE